MKKQLKPEMIGDFMKLPNGHLRDLSLHKEIQAQKVHGFNWRKKIRLEREAAALKESLTQQSLEAIAPTELTKPETQL